MISLNELIAGLSVKWTFELRCPESGMRMKANVGKQIPQERVEKHLADAIASFPYLTQVRFRERSSRKYITPWRTFREDEERKEGTLADVSKKIEGAFTTVQRANALDKIVRATQPGRTVVIFIVDEANDAEAERIVADALQRAGIEASYPFFHHDQEGTQP